MRRLVFFALLLAPFRLAGQDSRGQAIVSLYAGNSNQPQVAVNKPVTLRLTVYRLRPLLLGGTVTLHEGSRVLQTVTVDPLAPNAEYPVSITLSTLGYHTISADYSGDVEFRPASTTLMVEVRNPFAAITSLSPSWVVSSDQPVKITLEGTDFLPGMRVEAGRVTYDATVLSSTRATFVAAVQQPLDGGYYEIRAVNPEPALCCSQFAGMRVTPVLSPGNPVTIDSNARRITARVTPGSKTYWIYSGVSSDSVVATHGGADAEGDGVDTWTIAGPPLNYFSSSAVVDSTGARHVLPFQAWSKKPQFELGPNGKVSRLIMAGGARTGVLWVRPDVGGWSVEIVDGAASDADIPGVVNHRTVALTGSFKSLGDSPPPPDEFATGDTIVVIEATNGCTFATTLPDSATQPSFGGGQPAISTPATNTEFAETSAVHVWLDRNSGSQGTISARCTAVDDVAKAGLDYVPTTVDLTFGPGEYLRDLTIPLIDDHLYAGKRKVKLDCGSAGAATYVITDDDPPPVLTITDATVAEGDEGTRTATLTVSLIGATRVPARASWSALLAGVWTTGTVVFQPGETSQTIEIPYQADAVAGADRVIDVNLGSLVDATVAKAVGKLTILDDDAPRFAVDAVTAYEGATARFTVRLLRAAASTVRVDYATATGTAGSSDYAAASGRLTFAPGETEKTVAVRLFADSFAEPAEMFTLTLTNPDGAAIARGTATGVILDTASPLPSISVQDDRRIEGSGNTFTYLGIPLRLSAPSPEPVLVDYRFIDGAAKYWRGTSGDFSANSPYQLAGQIAFAAGETEKTITVDWVADDTNEPDKDFFLELSTPVHATLGRARARFVIEDDDDPEPTLYASDIRVVEGDSGVTKAVFTVELIPPQPKRIYGIYCASVATTANNTYDFVSRGDYVTFQPGEAKKEFVVQIVGDTKPEPDEIITLYMWPNSNSSARYTATCTIVNDDGPSSPPRHRSSGH